jgi:hypothetical protein
MVQGLLWEENAMPCSRLTEWIEKSGEALVELRGFEPPTPSVQARCSPVELQPLQTAASVMGSPLLGKEGEKVKTAG